MNQFVQLASLLEKGYPLAHSLLIVDENLQPIVDQLEQGISFYDCVLAKGKGAFYQHCRFFLELSTLPKAIMNAASLVEKQQAIKRLWLKETSYPLFILCFALITLFVFTTAIFPQLTLTFSEAENLNQLRLMITFMKGVTYGLLMLLIIVPLLCIICYLKPDYRSLLCRFPLFLELISYVIASDMLSLIHCGCSTKEMFTYLHHLRKQGLSADASNALFNALQAGESFEDTVTSSMYLSARFKYFFKCGLHTQQLSSCLDDYLLFQQQRWIRQIKLVCIGIQCFSYGFIALIVVLIYQIMLLPLEMIGSF
ncbi:type II secretion system F family protein [Dielma fastidiosa]|uniref:type II secretion system F family protein n=1 Tax=Dielma fastidiosa TaxID=1034346 RepID=UPI000D7B3088|nr:type II secretion system F family protein [Dielma fastidiosa]PWM55557.1 MAG: hypothetical protein DBX92_11580 [Dielma fastidiosa]